MDSLRTSTTYTRRARQAVSLSIALTLALASLPSAWARHSGPQARTCSQTAADMRAACGFEVADDTFVGKAICRNESDAGDRNDCLREIPAGARAASSECREQYTARLAVCRAVGEAEYDPEIDPADFVDPLEIGGSVAPNPFYPLVPGTIRRYEGGGETVTVTVTDETREIQGVTVLVVRDIVREGDEVIEDTRDWYTQDIHGNVWYFGEAVQDFEDGILVSIDGSFESGKEGSKAGIIMKAAPAVGETYRQEFALGNAEDLAEVVSLNGSASVPAATCSGNCLVTKDFTPLEPGNFENKYYKAGYGSILEENPAKGTRLELISIGP